jgi:dCMP deaminase
MPKKPYILVAYVPVLHRGYIELFEKFHDADALYLLAGEELLTDTYARKELRAMTPEQIAAAIEGIGILKHVEPVNKAGLQKLNKSGPRVVLPDEDISREAAEKYLTEAEATFYPIFLRWDRRKLDAEKLREQHDETPVSDAKVDVEMTKRAFEVAKQSSDIWRHVGAVLADGDKIVAESFNRSLSTPNTAWAEGNPRNLFNQGDGIDMSTFMHAEAGLIAAAAKSGHSLKGKTIYVTTFPCPPCAMLIAESGIAACRFAHGYSLLDGLRVMQEAGVDVKRVEADADDTDPAAWVPYPAKPRP